MSTQPTSAPRLRIFPPSPTGILKTSHLEYFGMLFLAAVLGNVGLTGSVVQIAPPFLHHAIKEKSDVGGRVYEGQHS